MYRAVINGNNTAIVIDRDTGQSGSYDNGRGQWCDFTFESIPIPSSETWEAASIYATPMLFKVENGSIVVRTIQEIGNNPKG